MHCDACGRELAANGMFPGAPVRCACGASQSVKVKEDEPRWSLVSAPTIPPPSSARGCPRCEAELEVRSVGGVIVGACPKAHGLFVTHTALRNVKKATPGVVAAIDEAPAVTSVGQEDALCPTCGETMSRAMANGVQTDVCATHGTWFDAGELRAAMAEDLLDTFNVLVLGGPSLRSR